MKVKYTQTITQLNQELRLAQEEARRNRNDTEIAEQKLLEFKRNMSNFKDNKDLQVWIKTQNEKFCKKIGKCHIRKLQFYCTSYRLSQ